MYLFVLACFVHDTKRKYDQKYIHTKPKKENLIHVGEVIDQMHPCKTMQTGLCCNNYMDLLN